MQASTGWIWSTSLTYEDFPSTDSVRDTVHVPTQILQIPVKPVFIQ
ncbi:hypothetical protein [Dulcicalothrix desertica]|nr:hypothetical protein [Dulcicalothrix desertica]